jgi:hypothetical protein
MDFEICLFEYSTSCNFDINFVFSFLNVLVRFLLLEYAIVFPDFILNFLIIFEQNMHCKLAFSSSFLNNLSKCKYGV